MFLDNFVPDEEHLLDYHNLKGRVYLTMDRNEEALTHLLPWLSGILQLRPDGTKKTQRRLARLGYACYTVGSAKAAILLQKKDAGENIRQEDFAEAMRYLEKGGEDGAGGRPGCELLSYDSGYLAAVPGVWQSGGCL